MLLATGSLGVARYAVTDRWGGVSSGTYAELNLGDHVGDEPEAVAENRRRLLAALPGARSLAFMSQVHGRQVVEAAAELAPTADALTTVEPGLAPVVLSADCVPVLLAGSEDRGVAVVHAGRLGVQRGVVAAAVDGLVRRGLSPDGLVALVGPAVCGRCYEVPAELRDEVAQVVPAAYARTRAGTPALDLPAAVTAQLRDLGVARVERVEICTLESADLFSHRREGVTGRLACTAWLPR